MKDNERQALDEVKAAQRGLPHSSDKTATSAGSLWWAVSRTLAAIVLLGFSALVVMSLTDPCFGFKLSVASSAGDAAAGVLQTVCAERSDGCHCSTKLEPCESGTVCSFSESSPAPQCGMLHVDCFF